VLTGLRRSMPHIHSNQRFPSDTCVISLLMTMHSAFVASSSPTNFNRSILVGGTLSPRASNTSGAIASRAKRLHPQLAIDCHALANRHKPRLNWQAGHFTSQMSCFVIGNAKPVMIKIYRNLRLGKTSGHMQRQINRILFNMGNGMKKRDLARGRLGNLPPWHLTRWRQ